VASQFRFTYHVVPARKKNAAASLDNRNFGTISKLNEEVISLSWNTLRIWTVTFWFIIELKIALDSMQKEIECGNKIGNFAATADKLV
jgi:hypothetical protein